MKFYFFQNALNVWIVSIIRQFADILEVCVDQIVCRLNFLV